MKLVLDLTSRTDERVKMLIEKQNELEIRINRLLENNQISDTHMREEINDLSEKIAIMENRDFAEEISEVQDNIHNIEIKIQNLNNRLGIHDKSWDKIFDAFWKICLIVIAGFILYKLGIQQPPG